MTGKVSATLGFVAPFFVLSACGSKDGSSSEQPTDERYLGLATPTDGFQLRSIGTEIAPSDEREYCEVGQLPGKPDDTYYVSLIELANGKSSHHFGLGVVTPGSSAETAVKALGVGNRTECPGPTIEFGEGVEIIATIQVPHGEATLPKGVARKYAGGQYIVYDYHYINTTLEPIPARSAANFHLVKLAEVEHVAQTFVINNLTVDIPPDQSASFTAECHFDSAMMLGAFTRHTHHWGTDFTVWYAGGAHDGEEIWTSHDWQHETEFTFTEPALINAGEGLRYSCSYTNDTSAPIRFGTRVKNEMCMLYGPVWAPNSGEQLSLKGCNIVWVDDAGIGHPANEAGGFPKPSTSDADLCKAGLGSNPDDCNTCRCDSCATPILKCAADADCGPLLACYAGCSDPDCIAGCSSLLRDHASGEGMLAAVVACSYAECPVCGAPTGTGLGAF